MYDQSCDLTPNSTCNNVKCDKSNPPIPLGRTSSNYNEVNQHNYMDDDTLYLDKNKTIDQVQEL